MQLCTECVEQFLKSFLENAQEAYKENEFYPVALPISFKDDDFDIEEPIPVIYKGESDKISVLLDIGAACWFQDVVDVVLILDGCGRKVDNIENLIENYDTERPSLYPESMRDNFLILTWIDLIDEDFKILMCKYKRHEDGQIVFEEEPKFMDDEDAVSSFVEFVVQGWNIMHRFLSDEENEKE
jgi:hypothetical protein